MKTLRSNLAKLLLTAVGAVVLAGATAVPAHAADRVVVRVDDHPHRYHWRGRYYEHRRWERNHWRYY